MNKLLCILVNVCVLKSACLAAVLPSDKIVPKFYSLITQNEKPSLADEKDFFGSDECDAVRSRILAKTTIQSNTPIWDYLRSHRELFITQNVKSPHQLLVIVSNPFRLMQLRPLENNILKNIRQRQVLATFPDNIVKGNAFNHLTYVVFVLGENCYLDIGSAIIGHIEKSLYEILYNQTK